MEVQIGFMAPICADAGDSALGAAHYVTWMDGRGRQNKDSHGGAHVLSAPALN